MIAAVRRWLGARELRRAELMSQARTLAPPPRARPDQIAAASTEVERAVRGYTHVLPLPEALAEELPQLTNAELGEHTRAVLAEHARRTGPAAWPRWSDTGE